jgi:hypothetical protein
MSQLVVSVCALVAACAAVLVAVSSWRLQRIAVANPAGNPAGNAAGTVVGSGQRGGLATGNAQGPGGASGPAAALVATDASESSAITQLAEAGATQANAMVRLAELSAQGLRASTGAYVFQLRDRFDEAFPVPQLTVSDGTWTAVAEENLGPVEYLVFHDGDRVRFTTTLVCNQAPLRRMIKLWTTELPDTVVATSVRYVTAQTQQTTNDGFSIAPDVTVFIELSLDLDVSALGIGRFHIEVTGTSENTNNRPEGAITTMDFTTVIEGTTVPDDDGVGFDMLSIETQVGLEQRSYFLDKQARLPLVLPIG